MASRVVEDGHQKNLQQLLSETGLECIRSPRQSLTSEESEEGLEEEALPEQLEIEPEEQIPEEEEPEQPEEIHEEEPLVFPTPSLRKVLPDRIRKIQEENRIHVLPEKFNTSIDPEAIPKIAKTPPKKYIEILAELVGCKMYKSSLAEFWFLDTMANLLRKAQEDELDRPTQAVLMIWFCEWMKEMQHFDAADRDRMMRRFKDNMLSAANFIAEEGYLPTPDIIGVSYQAEEVNPRLTETPSYHTTSIRKSKMEVTFEKTSYECALRDLVKIIHYIYDLFSTDYQYNLVRSVFTHSPDYEHIDYPYQINMPKRIYAPLKFKPKKDTTKKDKAVKGVKGKKEEKDTEEYLALMELKAREEKELEELEQQNQEAWNLKSHILPLSMAVTEEFFHKWWPPPPEPEPEPEPEPVVKGKGKKK